MTSVRIFVAKFFLLFSLQGLYLYRRVPSKILAHVKASLLLIIYVHREKVIFLVVPHISWFQLLAVCSFVYDESISFDMDK